jgi:hypothetical protein
MNHRLLVLLRSAFLFSFWHAHFVSCSFFTFFFQTKRNKVRFFNVLSPLYSFTSAQKSVRVSLSSSGSGLRSSPW